MGIQMKIPVLAIILVLAGVGTVSAQSLQSVPSVGGPGIGNSGSINGSGPINRASSTSSVGDSNPRASKNVEATNPGEYVPSTFENYDAAVDMGRNAGLARPLTIVEAARKAQHAKEAGAAKSTILLEKNAEGNLIIVPATAPSDVQSSAAPNAPASISGPAPAPVHTN
jgi:hypothetical protein